MKRSLLLTAVLLAGCGKPPTTAWTGYAEAEPVYIAPPVAGRLTTLAVQAGEAVAAGQPLFELDATPTTPTSPETTRVMLRNLLVERFGLEIVDESRLQRVLVITLPAWSQRGPTPCEPDLHRAMRDAERARRPCGFQLAPGRIDATAVDAEALAATLATTLGRRVFVERAAEGRFDIHLQGEHETVFFDI